MSAVGRHRRRALTASISTALLFTSASPAVHAVGGDESQADSQGSRNGRNITVQTKVQTRVSGQSGPAQTGSLSSENSNWTPPACWYEPAFSPKEIKEVVDSLDSMFLGLGKGIANIFKGYYADGDPYKNYNIDKQGKGMFWASAINPNRKDDPEAMACDKPPFWVDNNETPKEPLAVSPEILAEYAYDELPVPDTEISMSPDGKQTVNLDTWIWLDKAKFKPVSVTASIPNSGLSATTTATPVALTLDPGTEDAETHPASGECEIAENGSIGAPYKKSEEGKTPPCGITYLRSTENSQPHRLKATLTWEVSWKSTTGEGGDLPNGSFGTTTDVTVQEIQSINR